MEQFPEMEHHAYFFKKFQIVPNGSSETQSIINQL